MGVEWVLKRGQKGAKKGSKTIEKCTPQRLYRGAVGGRFFLSPRANRSEEHTSELQSPLNISYAVFCFMKSSLKPKPCERLSFETFTMVGNNVG